MVTTPLISYVRTLEERLAIAEGGAAASDTAKKKKKPPGKMELSKDVSDTALLGTSAQHESR